MRPDVGDLNDFYGSPLGRLTRRAIRLALRSLWPDVRGEAVLGFGYATPYLGLLRGEAARLIALMPAAQGVIAWPGDGPRLVAITEEDELPLGDDAIDRILLVHALEFSEQVQPLMRELWRVLRPGGRLLVIAPNRRSLWARIERTPFGHGHPFSASQLSRLLREHHFDPVRSDNTLFLPPLKGAMMLGASALWQRLGRRLGKPFGGVVMVEATKKIYGGQPIAQRIRRRRLMPMPAPAFPAGARISGRRAQGRDGA